MCLYCKLVELAKSLRDGSKSVKVKAGAQGYHTIDREDSPSLHEMDMPPPTFTHDALYKWFFKTNSQWKSLGIFPGCACIFALLAEEGGKRRRDTHQKTETMWGAKRKSTAEVVASLLNSAGAPAKKQRTNENLNQPMLPLSEEQQNDKENVSTTTAQLGGDIAEFECGVCLEKIVEQGLLNCCEHIFCFACIFKW